MSLTMVPASKSASRGDVLTSTPLHSPPLLSMSSRSTEYPSSDSVSIPIAGAGDGEFHDLSGVDGPISNIERLLVTSMNALTTTVHNKLSNVENKISHVESEMSHFRSELSCFGSDLNDQRSRMDQGFSDLKSDMSHLRSELKTDMSNMKSDLNEQISIVESNLHVTISDLRSEINIEFRSVRNDIALNKSAVKSVENVISQNESRSKARFEEIFTRFCTVDNEISQLNSKIDTKFQAVDSQLQSVHVEISALNSQIHSLQDDVDKIDSKVDRKFQSVDTKLNEFDAKIDTLHDKVCDIETKVVVLDGNFNQLNSKIDTLDRKIGCVNSRVENLDSDVKTLTTRLDSVQANITTFMTQQKNFNDRTEIKLIAMDENTGKKFLEIDTHIQKLSNDVSSVEKIVDDHSVKFQDYLKLIDVRKAEIRNDIKNEITTSVNESCNRLEQKIESSSQSLRSDVERLYTRTADFDVRMNHLEESLDGVPLDIVSFKDQINAITKQVNSLQPGLSSPLLSSTTDRSPATVAPHLRTPGVLPSPVSRVSGETPVSSAQLPVQNLQNSFNTPVSTVTVDQDTDNVQTNYDFLNSSGGVFLGNSQSTNKFSGFPDTNNSDQPTGAVGPTIIPSNNSSRSRRDPLSVPSQDAARGPNRVLPTYDGTEDLDVFFRKFEICIKNFNWTENEALSRLLSDSIQGQANTMISSLPFNFDMTYANVKTKLYTYFGPKRDEHYYQKKLQEISRQSGESLQKFSLRVADLANKAYPLSSKDRESNGVTAIIRGCNSDYVKHAALTNHFNVKTIDAAIDLLYDMENRSHVFQFNTNDARVRSIRSDKSPDSSSLNRDKKYSDHKSRDRSRNVSPRSHSPVSSSRNWDGRRSDDRSSRSDKQYSYKYTSRNSDYKSPDRYESRGSSVSPNRSSELDRKVRERQLWSPTSSPGRGRDRDKRSRQSLSPRDDRGGGSTNTCFTCGGRGHYAKECPSRPKKPTCYTCGETGHFVKDCPNRSRSRSTSPKVRFDDRDSNKSPR